MNEVWRDIPGFEGFYQGSTEGRIRTLPHLSNFGRWGGNGQKRKIRERILKQVDRGRGYFVVSLYKNGVHRLFNVHRLIAFTFPEICGEYFDGAEVLHLDENPGNNVATNLRWGTHTENNNWGTRLEKISKVMTNNPKLSKPVIQYTLDGDFVAEYPSAAEAGRQTGFKQGNISDNCRGNRKQAYGYIWSYGKMSL